jgi:CBS domain-containing protein
LGRHRVTRANAQDARAFTQVILSDIEALELMIERGKIEEGERRVGVEQEMNLVDAKGMVAPLATRLIEHLSDPTFQTEIALFNLEANLGPRPLDGQFLCDMEADLAKVVQLAQKGARDLGIEVLLAGITPTLRREDVLARNMTPDVRYECLDELALDSQGGAIKLLIDGIERFESQFDSVVVEGTNTSLQLHLQVTPGDAARLYNLAQLITAPLLAAATNSPVLLGKRLWHETRVAVFERTLDDRSASQLTRGVPTRVGFGSFWLKDSVIELFRDNIARYRVIMMIPELEDSVEVLGRGEVPELAALALHNGTVWRWNRACYGITNGKPHLRIENRILPGGPTVLDEVANAALFYGLMIRLDEQYGDVSEKLSFADAKTNLLSAARRGLHGRFQWLDGRNVIARDLLLEELIPAAGEGLSQVGVSGKDVDRYLGVIEQRVQSEQTGARWLLQNLATVPENERVAHCAEAVRMMLQKQQLNEPVHTWEDIERQDSGAKRMATTLADIMTADVFTVRPDDVVDLAASVMDWQHIRHVPVEDEQGKVIGLLTARELLHLHGRRRKEPQAVRDIMNTSFATAAPDLDVREAMRQMLAAETGCILVVREGLLVGIVTERDFLKAALAERSSDQVTE